MNPHSCEQLIYDKGYLNIQWGKDSLFNKMCQENWTFICKESFHIITRNQNVLDLNLKPETIKFLVENIGTMLSDIILSSKFLDISP